MASVIIFLIVGNAFSFTLGTISVFSREINQTVFVVDDDHVGSFVPELMPVVDFGTPNLVISNPPDACSPLSFNPVFRDEIEEKSIILLVMRGYCDFQTKLINAQSAGYNGVIIYNRHNDSLVTSWEIQDPESVYIYATLISHFDGLKLKSFSKLNGNFSSFDDDHRKYYFCINEDFSLKGYLLPFSIVIGFCFIVMTICMVRLIYTQIRRLIRSRRRSQRRKLPESALRKLPSKKWSKSDKFDTCAICLEDFTEFDIVRVIPCSHGYHTTCIDPWLTKGRRVCPICKRKVTVDENDGAITAVVHSDDSDDDNDDEDDDDNVLLLVSNSNNRSNQNDVNVSNGASSMGRFRNFVSRLCSRGEPSSSRIEETQSNSHRVDITIG